jgi:hypothetical protein
MGSAIRRAAYRSIGGACIVSGRSSLSSVQIVGAICV